MIDLAMNDFVLTTYLQPTVCLEKVSRLNEIIQGSGYTVRAAEAEKNFNQKAQELADEKEALRSIVTTLQDQVAESDEFGSERYIYSSAYLLGKLEEYVEPTPHKALAVLSMGSDETDDLTLNIDPLTEGADDSNCVGLDCNDQGLVDQEEYDVIDSIVKGIYGPRGLICATAAAESSPHDDDEPFDDARDDIGDDVSYADSVVDTDRVDEDEATSVKTDFHLDLVESTLNRNDGNKGIKPVLVDNWRDWLPSPPTSPCSPQSAAE